MKGPKHVLGAAQRWDKEEKPFPAECTFQVRDEKCVGSPQMIQKESR